MIRIDLDYGICIGWNAIEFSGALLSLQASVFSAHPLRTQRLSGGSSGIL
jgi:hypothetical protein